MSLKDLPSLVRKAESNRVKLNRDKSEVSQLALRCEAHKYRMEKLSLVSYAYGTG